MNWKGELAHVLTFMVLPCVAALATWIAFRTDRFDRWDRARWFRLAAALFLLTRLGTHAVVFHVFRYPGGDDLLRVWTPLGMALLEGRDIAPHIENLYGPLFPFVLTSGLALTGGRYPPAMDLPFIVADAFTLVLLHRIASRHLPETLARRLTLGVLLCPLVWHSVVVQTQDEPLFALFLLWSLDLFDRGKEFPGSVVAALGTLCTKVLFPLWIFPVLLAAGGGWRKTTTRVALAGGLTVLGIGINIAVDPGYIGRFHSPGIPYGSSAWLLAVDPGAVSPGAFRMGLAATAILCILAALFATRRPASSVDLAVNGVVAVQAAFFVACPYTFPVYAAMALPLLAWQCVRTGAATAPIASAPGLLLASFVIWQFPAVAIGGDRWAEFPWLTAAFLLWVLWTGVLALRAPRTGDS